MKRELFDKYIWLVDTIYRAGKITFEEINDKWLRSSLSEGVDLPLRTFHNWRIAIEQIFDINIDCDRRNGYVYSIENIDDMREGGVRTWLLNTFAVNNLINESHQLKKRILFEEIPSGQQFLTPIIEAMRDGLEIELLHQSYWYDEPSVYTVQPYCIKVFRQRWYVMGFCKERDAFRIFSLDRIHRLNILDKKFTFPKKFDPQEYFAESFGIIVDDEPVVTVRIKVYGTHILYVKALPLHHSQVEVEKAAEYSIFEYRLKPTFDFQQELLSRGNELEVLSPESLRKSITQTISSMATMYK